MKRLFFCHALSLVLAATLLTACSDDDEARMPMPEPVSTEYFESCVGGKGWQYVESHEIKANGTIEKKDYWEGLFGGSPEQYSFSGDSISTYRLIDAYPIRGYNRRGVTYDEGTNRLMSDGEEVFKVISVSPDELHIVRNQAMNGDGTRIYVYAVYRAMTPDELAACKSRHPYDLDTFNERYPALPQQENFTAADFARYAVGSGWKCAEAYRMETAGRYDAAQPVTAAARATADCMYISADTITTYAAPDGSVTAKGADARYTYHANGFYLSTGPAAGFKIISVDDAEMRIVRRIRPADGQKAANMYCVYRKMTDGELLLLRPEAAEGRQDLASK